MAAQYELLERTVSKLFKEGKLELPEGCDEQAHPEPSGPTLTTRVSTYRGKTIEIRTSYQILIDDKPIRAHVDVLDDGSVRCHGLPNYSFGSAVDLAHQLIDTFSVRRPDDQLNETKGKA